jgi:hypothetical protein
MNNAVLKIWINRKPVDQGKIFKMDKWYYLADMTERKWYINYAGYAIADQILKAFSKAKIKPVILYRRRDLNVVYKTNATRFVKKGIQRDDGGHRQWILPLKGNWDTLKAKPAEPFGLKAMTVQEWLDSDNDKPVKIAEDVMLRLKKEYEKKYA